MTHMTVARQETAGCSGLKMHADGELLCYQDLANAIIVQAAKDYQAAFKKRTALPASKYWREKAAGLERFFRTDWYAMLTDIDPEYLMDRLKGESV